YPAQTDIYTLSLHDALPILLNTDVSEVKTIEKIPFLPISFFKSENVLSSENPIEITFTSSGTTGQNTSSHFVTDVSVYEQSYLQDRKSTRLNSSHVKISYAV